MPGGTETTSMCLLCFGFNRKNPRASQRSISPHGRTPICLCISNSHTDLVCVPLSTASSVSQQIPQFLGTHCFPKTPRNPHSHRKSQADPFFGGATKKEARDKVTFKNKREISTTEDTNKRKFKRRKKVLKQGLGLKKLLLPSP